MLYTCVSQHLLLLSPRGWWTPSCTGVLPSQKPFFGFRHGSARQRLLMPSAHQIPVSLCHDLSKMHLTQLCKRAGILEKLGALLKGRCSQVSKTSSRFGHTLLYSANALHQGRPVRRAGAPSWESGRGLSRTPAGDHWGPAQWDSVWQMGWDGFTCTKHRAGEWDRMNSVCAAFIWTFCAKKWDLVPLGCCSSMLWEGRKALLALHIVVNNRKSLDGGWGWVSGWEEQSSMQTSYAHCDKTLNPLRTSQQIPSGGTASVSPDLWVCIHTSHSLEFTIWNGQASGVPVAELRMVVCPRSSETVVRPWLDLTVPTWDLPPDGTLCLFRAFCFDWTKWVQLEQNPGTLIFEPFSCICRAGEQLPAWLREDVGW